MRHDHGRPGPVGNATGRRVSWSGALILILLLAACDSDPLALFEDDPPEPQTASQADARQRSDAEAAAEKATPDLRDVPERPETVSTLTTREKVVEGLIADRENARYTDESIRLQGPGRQAPTAPPPESLTARTETASPPAEAAKALDTQRSASTTAATAVSATSGSAAGAVAAAPPPAPRPPTPVPQAPRLPSAQDSVAAPAPVARPVPEPVPPAATAANSDNPVVVNRAALASLGTQPASGPALRFADGDHVATIQFAHSSANLNAHDREILRQVAAIQQQSGGSLIIVGHASSRTRQLDKVAHELANLNISMSRANAVAEALTESGVSRDQVIVEAVSNARPMYIEAMPTGEAGNRRTEIFLVR